MKSLFMVMCCLALFTTTAKAVDIKEIKERHQKAAAAEKRIAASDGLKEASKNVLKLISPNKYASVESCTIGGGHCTFDSECCSDNCLNSVCQAGAGGCTVGGGGCTFDSECCSDNCRNNTCQSGNGCTVGGGGCTFDSECCSDNCHNGTCQAACGSSGDRCTYDHECCGGSCNSLGRCGSEPNCAQ